MSEKSGFKDGYLFARSYRQAARLDLQHFQTRELLGFNLHPSIPLAESTTIADVGTGTAIWANEIAATHPTVKVDACDVDLSQAPPREWLHPNVSLHQFDILGDVPAQFIGKYDIVHVRLFMMVVRENDPTPVIKNLMKMLKPGGWLQWVDTDWQSRHNIKARPDLPSDDYEACQAMFDSMGRLDTRMNATWFSKLDTFFKTCGLQDVRLHRVEQQPGPLAHYLNDQMYLAMEELSYTTLEKVGKGDEARLAIQKMAAQGFQGVALVMDRIVTVGRKPN